MNVIPLESFLNTLVRTNDWCLEDLARKRLRIQKHVLVVSFCKIPLPVMLLHYILILSKIVVVLASAVSGMDPDSQIKTHPPIKGSKPTSFGIDELNFTYWEAGYR